MMIRTYTELCQHETFHGRYEYLALHGVVGRSTFGFDRYVSQKFYTSKQWRQVRNDIIARDLGCDLACEGYEITSRLVIHHMNPLELHEIVEGLEWILDPEYLITTTHNTHNAIHYGDVNLLPKPIIQRNPGDTKLW